jgi:hypothetical protein
MWCHIQCWQIPDLATEFARTLEVQRPISVGLDSSRRRQQDEFSSCIFSCIAYWTIAGDRSHRIKSQYVLLLVVLDNAPQIQEREYRSCFCASRQISIFVLGQDGYLVVISYKR